MTNLVSLEQRANSWITGDDVGASSRLIWFTLMNGDTSHLSRPGAHQRDYPHDIQDFGRCRRLLTIVPEWTTQMHKMKMHGNTWSSIVDVWGKLTYVYDNIDKQNKDDLRFFGECLKKAISGRSIDKAIEEYMHQDQNTQLQYNTKAIIHLKEALAALENADEEVGINKTLVEVAIKTTKAVLLATKNIKHQ